MKIQLKHIYGKSAAALIRNELCCRLSAPELRQFYQRVEEINRCKVLLNKTCGYTTETPYASSPQAISYVLSCSGFERQHQPLQRLSNGTQGRLHTVLTIPADGIKAASSLSGFTSVAMPQVISDGHTYEKDVTKE